MDTFGCRIDQSCNMNSWPLRKLDGVLTRCYAARTWQNIVHALTIMSRFSVSSKASIQLPVEPRSISVKLYRRRITIVYTIHLADKDNQTRAKPNTSQGRRLWTLNLTCKCRLRHWFLARLDQCTFIRETLVVAQNSLPSYVSRRRIKILRKLMP